KARNSIVALSVSTSARRSSTRTGSPSLLCQADRTPSSMVGDSLGISRIFDILSLSGRGVLGAGREDALHRAHDAIDLGEAVLLELRVVRHRHVERGDPQDGGVEVVPREALDAVGDLGADAAVRPP